MVGSSEHKSLPSLELIHVNIIQGGFASQRHIIVASPLLAPGAGRQESTAKCKPLTFKKKYAACKRRVQASHPIHTSRATRIFGIQTGFRSFSKVSICSLCLDVYRAIHLSQDLPSAFSSPSITALLQRSVLDSSFSRCSEVSAEKTGSCRSSYDCEGIVEGC